MYMLILNFTYPLRCLRVPPVEYHCLRPLDYWDRHLREVISSNLGRMQAILTD